jgi:hypothetical protein
MSSKLSSLLVQDGVVSVKRMEEAFQRQVIYGGELDTVLLEMGAVDEPTLARYFHVCSGLPPGDLSEADFSKLREVAEFFPQKLAQKYRVGPVGRKGDTLDVVVSEGVGRSQLEELSFMLGLTLSPHVVPEVRLLQVLEGAYAMKLSLRFAGLVKKLGDPAPLRLAGVPAKVLQTGVLEGEANEAAAAAERAAGDVERPPAAAQPAPAESPQSSSAPPLEATEGPPAGPEAGDVWGSGDLGSAAAAEAEEPAAQQRTEASTLVGMPTRPEQATATGQQDETAGVATPGTPEERSDEGRTLLGMPTSETQPEAGAVSVTAQAPSEPAETAAPAHPAAAAAGEFERIPEEESVPLQEPKVTFDPSLVEVPPTAEEDEYPRLISPQEFAREAKGVIDVGKPTTRVVDESVQKQRSVEIALSPLGERRDEEVHRYAVAGTYEPAEAKQRFEKAENRDEIFEIMLRTVGSRVPFAALFVIYGDHAAGRMSIENGKVDTQTIGKIEIPLRSKSLFRTVVETASQYYGPVDDEGLNFSILTGMERLDAPNVLVLPVAIKSRVVCLVYADAAEELVSPDVVADLAAVPFMASQAFLRIIVKAKSTKYAAVTDDDSARLQTEGATVRKKRPTEQKEAVQSGEWQAAREAEALRMADRSGGGVSVSSGATASSQAAAEVRFQSSSMPTALSAEGVDALIDVMEEGGGRGEQAAGVLLGSEENRKKALQRIVQRFPGRLLVDRFAPGVKLPPVSQHGALLNFLVWSGGEAVPYILPMLEAEDAEVRFYATLLFTEISADEAVGPLYQRLFDGEVSVRKAATDALRHCARANRMNTVLEYLRGVLQQGVAFHRACAADAVGAFRDSVSVPILISMVDDQSRHVAESARRALLLITKQAFGESRGEWLAWWERNGERHRIEWMIDALVHPDVECRFMAFQELKQITQKEFGYRFDLPLKERHAAVARWRQWWKEAGKAFRGAP